MLFGNCGRIPNDKVATIMHCVFMSVLRDRGATSLLRSALGKIRDFRLSSVLG